MAADYMDSDRIRRFYIHESMDNKPVEMDEDVTFIQIMDAARLNKEHTKKFSQWRNIEKSIRAILPVKGSNITNYGLFYGTVSDFEDDEYSQDLITFIKKAIQ